MTTSEVAPRERLALLVLLIAFFLFGLFDHSFWASNDSREGAMIWDMVQAGHWVTPTLNGVPYLEKPPLLHWTGMLFCQLFGTVNEGLVRLPAALYGLGAVLLAWFWGRRLGRERAGIAAAFLCATSFKYMEYSKIVLTDACISFMVMASLVLFWEAYTATRNRALRFAVFILVSALSFYAKGLLGPGFVWVSVGCFLLYRREWKLCLILPAIFLPVLVLVLAPWAWALWKEGGMEFICGVFWDNQFGRFLSFSDPDLPPDPYFVHKEPFYYYLVTLPGAVLPWTLLMIPAMIRWFRRGQGWGDPLSIFMRFCIACMLLVLHASSAKVSIYALPLFPIAFLMTAIWCEEAAERWTLKTERWALGVTAYALKVVLVLAPVFYFILFLLPRGLRKKYLEDVDILRDLGAPTALFTAALAVALLGLALWTWRRLRADFQRGDRARVILFMPAAYTALLMLAGAVFFPIYDYQRGYPPFAALLSSELAQGREIVLATTEEKYVGAFTFYTRRRLPTAEFSASLRQRLEGATAPIGVLVKTKDLKKHGKEWGLDQFKALRPVHNGYMSDKFRLLVNEPAP